MALVNFKEMLARASAGRYAVGMFDVSDLEMVRAVVQEAEKLRAPVILGALAPDLEGDRLEYWFALAELAAKKSSAPVCIHLDHANTLQEVSVGKSDRNPSGGKKAAGLVLFIQFFSDVPTVSSGSSRFRSRRNVPKRKNATPYIFIFGYPAAAR